MKRNSNCSAGVVIVVVDVAVVAAAVACSHFAAAFCNYYLSWAHCKIPLIRMPHRALVSPAAQSTN